MTDNDKAAKTGEESFRKLFYLYYPKVKVFAYHLVKSEEEAEEIAHIVFVKLWINWSNLRCTDNLDGYIFTVTRNCVFDYFRERKMTERLRFSMGQASDDSRTDDPYSFINLHQLQETISETLDEMPEKRKLVFTMSRLEGLDNDSIARKLEISKRTVETHISNALREIRENLKKKEA